MIVWQEVSPKGFPQQQTKILTPLLHPHTKHKDQVGGLIIQRAATGVALQHQ